jgi:hypothetical protein
MLKMLEFCRLKRKWGNFRLARVQCHRGQSSEVTLSNYIDFRSAVENGEKELD